MADNKNLKSKIMDVLSEINDPELYVSIVDLGLIYDVGFKKGKVDIKMTLTSMGCPLFPVIESQITDRVAEIKGVKDVRVKLVFDPPWSMDRMSKRAKTILGI